MGISIGRQLGWLPPKPPSQHLGVLPVLGIEQLWHRGGKARLDVPDVLGLCSQGDVVVNELSPGNQQDRDSVVMESLVLGKAENYSQIQIVQIALLDLQEGLAEQDLVEVSGDGSGGGEGVAGDGGARGGDAVRVVRGQEAVVAWGWGHCNLGLLSGQN